MEDKEKKFMGAEPLSEEALQEVAGGVGAFERDDTGGRFVGATSSDPALKDPIRKLDDPLRGDHDPFRFTMGGGLSF